MTCGQIRWTWQSMAPAVRILPLPAITSVDGPMARPGVTPSMVSGLPALPIAADAPVPYADVGFDHAPVVEDYGPGDNQVRRSLGRRRPALAHRLADHFAPAEDSLVAGSARAAAEVLGHLDEQVGVGQPDPVAGGRPVKGGVTGPGQSQSSTAFHLAPEAGDERAPPKGHQSTSTAMPGSKRTLVPAGYRQAVAPGRRPGRNPGPGWPRRNESGSPPARAGRRCCSPAER